jgi:hypothetical protein
MALRPDHAFIQLQRIQRVKQSAPKVTEKLGVEALSFFKQCVAKRQTKLGQIAQAWATLVPETLSRHCSLEALHRGTLTVIVDSSPHLYELKQLLLAGIQQQLLMACRSAGLRKITLKAGRWYSGEGAEGRAKFE